MPAAGEPAVLFLLANTARQLVGISVGIGSHRRQKLFKIQLVMVLGGYRPGAPEIFFRAVIFIDQFGLGVGSDRGGDVSYSRMSLIQGRADSTTGVRFSAELYRPDAESVCGRCSKPSISALFPPSKSCEASSR